MVVESSCVVTGAVDVVLTLGVGVLSGVCVSSMVVELKIPATGGSCDSVVGTTVCVSVGRSVSGGAELPHAKAKTHKPEIHRWWGDMAE